jgi:type IV pilus assembly protein PilM
LSQRLGWIGVDVGTHTVKLAQAVREGAEVRLHRAAVIQRPAVWSGDDALALEQPMTSSPEIRAALECGGFAGRDAVCSLPMNVCQLRALSVPPGSDQERRAMIADELAEDWADHRQPMEFDFWELESSRAEKGSEGFNVSVLATSRLWVNQLWRDCRQSGLDCWSIDAVPLAMARAVALVGGTAGGRRVLAVDWGYSNTTLCVLGDGRPLYSRRIHDCAFGSVLEAIMQAFDATLDEAQHLAERCGLAAPAAKSLAPVVRASSDAAPSGTAGRPATTGGQLEEKVAFGLADQAVRTAITDAVAAPIQELTRQIKRTLEFMEAQRRQHQPAAVWLMGGGASMANAAPYLEQPLGLPVHVWKLPARDMPIPCAALARSAVFGPAVALSASVWRAA